MVPFLRHPYLTHRHEFIRTMLVPLNSLRDVSNDLDVNPQRSTLTREVSKRRRLRDHVDLDNRDTNVGGPVTSQVPQSQRLERGFTVAYAIRGKRLCKPSFAAITNGSVSSITSSVSELSPSASPTLRPVHGAARG